VEQELAAVSGERQVPQFVQDHKVEPGKGLGQFAAAIGQFLLFKLVDQVEQVEERSGQPPGTPSASRETAWGDPDARNPPSTASAKNSFLTPKLALVCMGFAVRATSNEIPLVLMEGLQGIGSPESSGFLSENLAGGLVDLLDLEPFVAMLGVYMAHQRFNDNLSGFPLLHEITVHPQFLATDRHRHCPSPIAQPIYPEIPVYCVHIRWAPIPWEFRKTNK
jgi:hypothetical protein